MENVCLKCINLSWRTLYMLMFPSRRRYHHNLRSTDGLTILANWLEIAAILVHYQPFYITSHTMKHSYPQLLADGALYAGCILQTKFTSLNI